MVSFQNILSIMAAYPFSVCTKNSSICIDTWGRLHLKSKSESRSLRRYLSLWCYQNMLFWSDESVSHSIFSITIQVIRITIIEMNESDICCIRKRMENIHFFVFEIWILLYIFSRILSIYRQGSINSWPFLTIHLLNNSPK